MKILIAMMSVLILSSCAIDQCGPTKEEFLKNYESFVDKVESKNLSSDEEAWKNLDQKFEQYISECYNEFDTELSSSEHIDVASNTVRYYYSKYGRDISDHLGSDPEEITRKITKNVEDFLHGNEGDIEALVEEFSSRVDREDLDEFIAKGSEIFKALTEDIDN